MYRGNSSRILPVVLILIVAAIVIAGLVSLGRVIFGGGQSTEKKPVDTSREALLSVFPSNSVRMTVRGPLVADEQFRSYRITVDPEGRNLTIFSGYLDQVLTSTQLNNNTKAYEQLVYALDKANMVKGIPFTDAKDDTRGICATGRVYEFEVVKSGNVVKRLWTSTCKGSSGSLRASRDQLYNLFMQQIPDGEKSIRQHLKQEHSL